MTLSGRDVLLIGPYLHRCTGPVGPTARVGTSMPFCRHYASGFRSITFHPVILCSVMRICPTGLCFGLLVNLAGLPVTAFLCLPVENGCFWLPAIDDGKECLGLPALRPSEFAKTLEEMTQSL